MSDETSRKPPLERHREPHEIYLLAAHLVILGHFDTFGHFGSKFGSFCSKT